MALTPLAPEPRPRASRYVPRPPAPAKTVLRPTRLKATPPTPSPTPPSAARAGAPTRKHRRRADHVPSWSLPADWHVPATPLPLPTPTAPHQPSPVSAALGAPPHQPRGLGPRTVRPNLRVRATRPGEDA